jgi:hypothetical protein
MNSNRYSKRLAFFLLFLATVVMAQDQKVSLIQDSVDEIIRSTLREGEFSVNGVRAVRMRTVPSKDALAKIESFGEAAIPALAKHLEEQDPREQQLAVRLIGVIGGPKIVLPLSNAVHYSRFAVTRMMALDFITSAPEKDFVPIVKSALNDQDALVRKEATEVLQRCCPQELQPTN